MTTPAATEVHGYVKPGFEPVREAFVANFEAGMEVGAAFAATVGGEPVVDIWAGHFDEARTRPWERDTIACVFSTTKATVATACAMLVDRGLLEYEQPVAKYWPEFAQQGKDNITVGQLLSHQAGVPGITNRELPDYYTWDSVTEALAAETPWWEPGSANGYHAVSFGHLGGRTGPPNHRQELRPVRARGDRRPTWRRLPRRLRPRTGRPRDTDDPAGRP